MLGHSPGHAGLAHVLLLAAGDGAVAGLQDQLAALLPPSHAAAGGTASSSGQGGQHVQQQQQLSAAMQRRIQHNIQLAARCAKLENEKQQLAREKSEVQGELEHLLISSCC